MDLSPTGNLLSVGNDNEHNASSSGVVLFEEAARVVGLVDFA
jgi:hypothetical protein